MKRSIRFSKGRRPEKWPRGFAEPTASIIWSALLGLGVPADAFVLWSEP
jgi:hypothetical protein